MNSDERERQARQRFMILNLIRFSGVGIVMLGVASVAGKFLPELGPEFGTLLMLIGMVEFFFLPIIVKKGWRRKDSGQG